MRLWMFTAAVARIVEQRRRRCGAAERAIVADKRLERGRFIWPSVVDGAVTVSSAHFGYILEGIDWRNPQHTWRPSAAG